MGRQEFLENLSVALETLRARKVRSGLTILGIVIGVTSVIAVASIIDGLNGYIQNRVARLGSRTLFLTRFPAGQDPSRMAQKYRVRKYLEPEDATYLQKSCPYLEYATPFANRINFNEQNDTIRYGDAHVERLFVRGVAPQYVNAIPLFSVAEGRFISVSDEEHARDVVILGDAIANSLFGQLDPLGKMVRLNGRLYEVIGVFDKDPGLFGGFGVDIFACIPFSNYRKNYPENKETFIAAAVREDASIDAAKGQITEALRRRRKVPHGADDDFEVTTPDFLSNLWGQLTGALFLLTGIISSIGLLVGGIGVMNIMLISVTERTAEIGIRKAIGARKADIRVQFLMEAMTLSALGGVLGIVCGWLIAFLVRTAVPSIPATVSIIWVAMGVMISMSVGLFFGFYPANRAANLDPIVCLRYE